MQKNIEWAIEDADNNKGEKAAKLAKKFRSVWFDDTSFDWIKPIELIEATATYMGADLESEMPSEIDETVKTAEEKGMLVSGQERGRGLLHAYGDILHLKWGKGPSAKFWALFCGTESRVQALQDMEAPLCVEIVVPWYRCHGTDSLRDQGDCS